MKLTMLLKQLGYVPKSNNSTTVAELNEFAQVNKISFSKKSQLSREDKVNELLSYFERNPIISWLMKGAGGTGGGAGAEEEVEELVEELGEGYLTKKALEHTMPTTQQSFAILIG